METSIELPPNFQEEMMNCELEFQEGINEDIIRKLMYIYTLGMQYYNINEKAGYEKYYRNKLNNLLLNDNVITYLDTHQVDLSKRVELNLFEKKEEKTEPKKEETTEKPLKKIDIEVISLDTKEETTKEKLPKKVKIDANNLEKKEGFKNKSDLLRSKTILVNKKKDKINREDIMEYVTRKIKEVDIRLVSIDKQVSNNIVEQMSSFESNKRNKKVKKLQNSEKKEEKVSENTINDNNDNNIIVKKDSSNQDSIDIDLEIAKMQKKNLKRRGSSIGQTKLLKEIEEYVEQHMQEMYKALEELRQSYAGEIKEAEDSGFDEIAESLRNDLKFEEENLTAQYEEERMKQIELIREKNKKN
jgi:hypothetical protein